MFLMFIRTGREGWPVDTSTVDTYSSIELDKIHVSTKQACSSGSWNIRLKPMVKAFRQIASFQPFLINQMKPGKIAGLHFQYIFHLVFADHRVVERQRRLVSLVIGRIHG